MWLSTVVFPDPKYPLNTVTGVLRLFNLNPPSLFSGFELLAMRTRFAEVPVKRVRNHYEDRACQHDERFEPFA
jgi:hypothetical protein